MKRFGVGQKRQEPLTEPLCLAKCASKLRSVTSARRRLPEIHSGLKFPRKVQPHPQRSRESVSPSELRSRQYDERAAHCHLTRVRASTRARYRVVPRINSLGRAQPSRCLGAATAQRRCESPEGAARTHEIHSNAIRGPIHTDTSKAWPRSLGSFPRVLACSEPSSRLPKSIFTKDSLRRRSRDSASETK